MYKILGADGKEYGPVTLEQLQRWRIQGRINARTKVQAPGTTVWSDASEVPELASIFIPPAPPPLPPRLPPLKPPAPAQQGLAIASLVLGIVSFVFCLFVLTAIPAIVCGHKARRRSRESPERFGGSGLALAGLTLGYINLGVALAIGIAWLPSAAKAKVETRSAACANHLKQVGLAFKVWAIDHGDEYPFNVSTNNGGTKELCAPLKDGYDANAVVHLRVLANEIGSPRVLVCPADRQKQPASDFASLQPAQISYRFRSGPNVNDTNPQEVLAVCPLHGHVLRCDGSVDGEGVRPDR